MSFIDYFRDGITNFAAETGVAKLFDAALDNGNLLNLVMIAIACVLMYLAIVKGFEPMLLLPIAFGMALANLPGSGVFHADYFTQETIDYGLVLHEGGLLDLLYLGVKLGIYPPLIFL